MPGAPASGERRRRAAKLGNLSLALSYLLLGAQVVLAAAVVIFLQLACSYRDSGKKSKDNAKERKTKKTASLLRLANATKNNDNQHATTYKQTALRRRPAGRPCR